MPVKSNITKAIENGMTVGKSTFLRAHVQKGNAEKVTIGNYVVIGHDSYIVTHCPIKSFTDKNEIIIEDFVWIGSRTTILPGVVVGRGSLVGAASVITKDIEPFSIVGGNPAVRMRTRDPYELLRTFVIRYLMKKSLNGKTNPDWNLLRDKYIKSIFLLPRNYLLGENDPLKGLIPWEVEEFSVDYFFERLNQVAKNQ